MIPGLVSIIGTGAAPLVGSTQWRIFCDESGHHRYTTILEIEMATSIGGANACVGGTASSGDNRNGYPASEAFDGDKVSSDHGWSIDKVITTDPADRWVQYTFLTPVVIEEIRLWAPVDTDTSFEAPVSFRLQYYDGSSWVDYFTLNYQPFWEPSETRIFTGDLDRQVSGSAQYWRVWASKSDHASYIHIAELEMRNTVSGPDITTTGNAISGGARSSFPDTEAFDDIVAGNNSWGVEVSVHSISERWVGQNFGSAQSIAEIQMTARADGFPGQTPNTFFLESSSDGINWDPVLFVEDVGASWSSSESRLYTT